jgi:hypothetical protein
MSDDESEASIEITDSNCEEEASFADLLNTFLTSKDGVNVADNIAQVKTAIDTQNKILHRMMLAIEKSVKEKQ